jgi:hypothetical protein
MKKLVHAVLEQGVDIIDLQSWIKILPTAKFRDLLLRPLQRYLSFVAAHQHNTVRLPYLDSPMSACRAAAEDA